MILNRQRAVRVARRPLEAFLHRVERTLGLGETDVTICLVSDAEMARMNERFRRKKGSTDVLSFPTREDQPGRRKAPPRQRRAKTNPTRAKNCLGDIAIAPQTARRYAKKNGRTLNSELRVLVLHGVLHLLGYDHETDHGEMDRVEEKMRRRFGLV